MNGLNLITGRGDSADTCIVLSTHERSASGNDKVLTCPMTRPPKLGYHNRASSAAARRLGVPCTASLPAERAPLARSFFATKG